MAQPKRSAARAATLMVRLSVEERDAVRSDALCEGITLQQLLHDRVVGKPKQDAMSSP